MFTKYKNKKHLHFRKVKERFSQQLKIPVPRNSVRINTIQAFALKFENTFRINLPKTMRLRKTEQNQPTKKRQLEKYHINYGLIKWPLNHADCALFLFCGTFFCPLLKSSEWNPFIYKQAVYRKRTTKDVFKIIPAIN